MVNTIHKKDNVSFILALTFCAMSFFGCNKTSEPEVDKFEALTKSKGWMLVQSNVIPMLNGTNDYQSLLPTTQKNHVLKFSVDDVPVPTPSNPTNTIKVNVVGRGETLTNPFYTYGTWSFGTFEATPQFSSQIGPKGYGTNNTNFIRLRFTNNGSTPISTPVTVTCQITNIGNMEVSYTKIVNNVPTTIVENANALKINFLRSIDNVVYSFTETYISQGNL